MHVRFRKVQVWLGVLVTLVLVAAWPAAAARPHRGPSVRPTSRPVQPPIRVLLETVGFGELRVDGAVQLDPTLPLDLPPGRHVFEWERSLHPTERTELQLPLAATHTSDVLRLGTQAHWGELTVVSEPSNAQVMLNQTVIGLTPLRVPYVQPGELQLVVGGLDTYPAARATHIVAGQTTQEAFRLRGKDVLVSIRVLDAKDQELRGLTVYANGEWLGVSPLSVKLLPGQRRLSADLPDGRTLEQDVTVLGGDAQDVVLKVAQ